MKNDFEKILIFFKVNPTRTWPYSYVSPIGMENQGSRSSRIKKLFEKDERVCKLKLF